MQSGRRGRRGLFQCLLKDLIVDRMNVTEVAASKPAAARGRWLTAGVLLLASATLVACGDKEKKAGQSLVSVNGEEITVLQLNEELQRSNVPAAQQEAAKKQLLSSLIDRQLLLNEAAKDKLDRDPKVVQAVERARALIIAQAYLQKRTGAAQRPSRAEVEAYFNKHPEFFLQRKQFDMRQLVMESAGINAELKAAIDGAKSLDEVAAWMDAHRVKYARAQVSRTSADLPPELSARLLAMDKGQMFIIKEGARSLLVSIAEIKPSPVSLETATGQIEQFLANQKAKEAAEAEVARLRASAKIVYLNKEAEAAAAAASAPAPAPAPAAAPAAAAPAAAAPAADTPTESNVRGVQGLK